MGARSAFASAVGARDVALAGCGAGRMCGAAQASGVCGREQWVLRQAQASGVCGREQWVLRQGRGASRPAQPHARSSPLRCT